MLVQSKTQLGESTIQRNEEFGEYSTAGVEWTAYVTITKKGKLIMDSLLDRGNIGSEIPYAFLEDNRDALVRKEPFENSFYKGLYFFIIYSRDQEQFHVANLYVRRTPFSEKDMNWMRIYTQANLKITQLYLDLLKQQEYIHTTFDSLSSAILTLNSKGKILLYNYPAVQLFSFDPVGTDDNLYLKDLLPDKVWDRASEAIQRVKETNKQVVLDNILFPLDDIHQIWSFTFAPLQSSDVKMNDIILLAQDKTVQTLLDQELEKRAQYELLGDVAVGLAHDIKNPLTNILGCARIGTRTDCQSRVRSEMMNIISHEVDRITLVLNQMLSYGKLTQYSPETALNVNAILETCMSVIERQKFERKITVQADLDPSLPLVFGREIQLQQVFLNVLINALQAIPDCGTISVRSQWDKDGDRIVIDIIDSGTGIDKSSMNRLFSPYYTTKKGGTGLGLFASKKSIEQFGGEIELMPREEGGAHCRIILPINPS